MLLNSGATNTVWLVGAGFSRPLGGPLFTNLISVQTARWVNAWIESKGVQLEDQKITFDDCVKIYTQGVANALWSNAEECIALLDEARLRGSIAERVVHSAFKHQNNVKVEERLDINKIGLDGLDLEQVFARVTQFLAIATSYYVPSRGERFPESWRPYLSWTLTLGEHDTIVSFNYDHVVEALRATTEREFLLIKLHGTVPEHEELVTMVREIRPVREICVPGPSKLARSLNELAPEWERAAAVLQNADRLVVIGYSFPDSDSMAREFVLRYCYATCVDIVVGPNEPDCTRVRDVFDHLKERGVNTRRYAQTFLTDGTARSDDGKFIHRSQPLEQPELTLDTLAEGKFKFGKQRP